MYTVIQGYNKHQTCFVNYQTCFCVFVNSIVDEKKSVQKAKKKLQ